MCVVGSTRIYKDLSSTKPSDLPPTTLNAFADLQNDDYGVVRVMIVIKIPSEMEVAPRYNC